MASAISNVQVNATDKVPSSALVNIMQQAITQNANNIATLNGEMIKTADATWFDNGLKISIIGTPGDANYRLSFQSKKNNVWYGDILFDRHD